MRTTTATVLLTNSLSRNGSHILHGCGEETTFTTNYRSMRDYLKSKGVRDGGKRFVLRCPAVDSRRMSMKWQMT